MIFGTYFFENKKYIIITIVIIIQLHIFFQISDTNIGYEYWVSSDFPTLFSTGAFIR